MGSPKRLAKAFGRMAGGMDELLGMVGWTAADGRGARLMAAASGDPKLAARLAEIASVTDPIEQGRQMRQFAAQNMSLTDPSPAAPPPATPRLEPPGKPSVEAQRQRVEAELGREQMQGGYDPASPGPLADRIEQARRQKAEAPIDPVAPDQTYPKPDLQMDLQPSRAGETIGDAPDPARASLSDAEDVGMGSPTSGPPAAWASDPSAPGFRQPIDNLIDRLGGSPAMPVEALAPAKPRGAWRAGENIPGAGSMDDLLDEIDARRATRPPPPQADSPTRAPNGDMVYPDGSRVRPNELTWSQGNKWSPGEAPPRDMPPPRMDDATPPRDMPPPRTPDGPTPRDMPGSPEASGRKPRMSDMAKRGVAGGVIGAGIGGGLLLPGNERPPAVPVPNSLPQPPAGPVPNIIRPPQPMSTADLAAQTRPPPSVQTPAPVSPRDQAMKMIDDLNARRRAAGGEVPDAQETMRKVNNLLAMSNEQSAAASRGDIPVQGNSPREQAQRILAQLNAMRRQAGGEVPQAGQMMAEVRRLQAISDQQANARR